VAINESQNIEIKVTYDRSSEQDSSMIQTVDEPSEIPEEYLEENPQEYPEEISEETDTPTITITAPSPNVNDDRHTDVEVGTDEGDYSNYGKKICNCNCNSCTIL